MAITKVLIVDDSKTELMFMTALLQKNGMTVRTAQGADDAFKRLAEEKPDLILMDVVMPGAKRLPADPRDQPHTGIRRRADHHVHQQKP